MERPTNARLAEPALSPSTGGSAGRATLYGLLALLLAAGGWVRFNQQIGAVAPWAASPVAASLAASDHAGANASREVRGLLELQMVPQGQEATLVAGLGLPADQSGAMLAALKRNKLRLVQLPLFDAGIAAADGTDAGRMVSVSSGGFSRIVRLGRQPVMVTLPIDRVGTVSFRVPASLPDAAVGPAGVGIGALTMAGPVRFPDLSRGQELEVGVVAE